jgi:hypothetical protein
MLNGQGVSRLRMILLFTFLTTTMGIAFELYLLGHHEDNWQLIPLICIGASLFFTGLFLFKRTKFNRGLLFIVLLIDALSGLYGVFLHLQANYEFELEMRPSLSGWELFKESLSGALPALAPGSMVIIALIGFSYLTLITNKP